MMPPKTALFMYELGVGTGVRDPELERARRERIAEQHPPRPHLVPCSCEECYRWATAIVRAPRRRFPPRHDVDSVATDGELNAVERKVPRSDDVAEWQELCAPIVELLAAGPLTLAALRAWALAQQKPRIGVQLAEEGLFWLENRGRVVGARRPDGARVYHLVGAEVRR